MSNSTLVGYTNLSPNRTSPRRHAIDTITIHCVVGQWTAKQGCDYFTDASLRAAPNYFVGKDGSIGQCVDEKDRSWCSSNDDNDHRAVTIETASDKTHPYAVTDAAYAALVDLVTDICRRNGAKKLLWFADKEKTLAYTPKAGEMVMTVHRWFANKACPGDYLYERHGAIAAEVTARLGGVEDGPAAKEDTDGLYRVRRSWEDTGSQIGAFSVLDNAKAMADQNPGYLVFDDKGVVVYPMEEETFAPYPVRIDVTDLRIRSGPGTGYAVKGYTGRGVFTIVDECAGEGSAKGWGRLKSGAGWIALDYAQRC